MITHSLEIIEARGKEGLDIASWSDAVGVSAPTLYRAFKERFGLSPKQYLSGYRLTQVRRALLRETAKPVHAVAG